MKFLSTTLAATLLLLTLTSAWSQSAASDNHAHSATSAAGHNMPTPTAGEVRRIDKNAHKITLRHEAIINLDMPAMSMVFQVQDLALLDSVKPGDQVIFTAEQVNGAYVVRTLKATARK